METKRQAIAPYERPIIREKIKKEPQKPANPFRDYVRKQRAKKIKPFIAVMVIIGIWYLLIGRDILPQFVQNLEWSRKKQAEEGPKYYEVSCSEANLARMLTLCCYNKAEQGDKKEEIEEQTLWYEKYYDSLQKEQIKSLQEDDAFKLVSYEKLQQVFCEVFGDSIADIVLEPKDNYQLYEVIGYIENALSKTGKGKISYRKDAILATPDDELPLGAWEVVTNEGVLRFEGLVVAPLKNKTVTMALCGSEILGIIQVESDSCQVMGCKVVKLEGENVVYDMGGCTFVYKNHILTQEQVGGIYDLTLQKNEIIDFKVCSYDKEDTLVKLTDKAITLERGGTFLYDKVAVHDATELNRFHSLQDLTYGTKVEYMEENGRITALQVVGQGYQQAIRVVLTDEKGNHEQQRVLLKSDADYDKVYQEKASTLEAGTQWDSGSFQMKEGESIRFVPRGDSRLIWVNVKKGNECPGYKGMIEVTKTQEGYVVVNEVDLEEYVAGVIPSEMPASYGKEALKAQAVAARTFGASCMENGRMMVYGAHVDDTTASQVYNRLESNEAAYEAARETAGLVLKSQGKLISDKFFTASCGYTANYGDTWGGETPSYLHAEKQFEDQLDYNNLSSEKQFENFISLGPDDLDAYDEASPWFRWHCSLDHDTLEKLILPSLKAMSEKKNSPISYETADGKTSDKIEDIGSIKQLEIRKRGEGGNIKILAVVGTKGTALVHNEYAIRSLFAANSKADVEITRQDGSTVNDLYLLPSAFFTLSQEIDQQSGFLTTLTIQGGGSGHGVGLSQDGAKGLAERGKDFKEILAHYYKGTELVNMWK